MRLKITTSVVFMLLISAVFVRLNAQDILQAGNLESETGWSTTYLNTPGGSEPAVTWNYTTDTPTSGQGGNLHVSGMSNNSTVQYCIYQPVHLSKDSLYTFDGAFKSILLNNAWCEVFLGTAPVPGADYGEGQFKLSAFSFWGNPSASDGTFSANAADFAPMVPDTSGNYYFVLKMGSTSWDGTDQSFEIIVDELTLTREKVAPIVDFAASATTGFAPLTVEFTDMSAFATSWSWDFGDGSAVSNEQNPVHIYNDPGTYTVSLTAGNTIGDNTGTKENLIVVSPAEVLTGGGVLTGADMEADLAWSTSFLNTPAGSEPTVTWNYTTTTPDAGQGGCLYVNGNSNNNTTQFCIYQEVILSADSVYYFDGAFRDLTSGLDQAWCEIYIGTEPIDGLDYGEGQQKIAQFNTWDGGCSGVGVNGTFKKNGCTYGGFIPEATGTHFFVVKMGTWSGEAVDKPYTFAIDELSLVGQRSKPYTAFTSPNPNGFAPLTTEFVNKSKFAVSYTWDFGDGSATSTEMNPSHTYSNPGQYTVSLTAVNEIGDSTISKTDYIKVNEKPELPEGEKLYGGNMEEPNLWNITSLNQTGSTTAIWNYTDNVPAYGSGGALYINGSSGTNTQSQFCIWQAVELNADSVYNFNAAFMAISELDRFWAEVFIGTVPPTDGEDYGDDTIKIAQFSTWASCTGIGVDGTFLDNGCILMPDFSPEETGTYYFALKVGCIDWENNPTSFEIVIDELTLQESTFLPKPEAEFFTDVTSGDAPLSVYFTDLSTNANAWLWDFGDGSTSTEQHPNHTYTDPGVYTVSLVAFNGELSDTMTVEDLITVTGTNGIANGKLNLLKVYPNPSYGMIKIDLPDDMEATLRVTNILGSEILRRDIEKGVSRTELNIETPGIYFISYSTENYREICRLVVR